MKDEAPLEGGDEAQAPEVVVQDGAGGLLALFVSGGLGGFAVMTALVLQPTHCCHGATRTDREARARCQALGVTPEELAALEARR